MTICYYPPTTQKQEVLVPRVVNNEVKLYSSVIPVAIVPIISVLANLTSVAINLGWALLFVNLILSIFKFVKSRDVAEFISDLKRYAVAAVLIWMLPCLPIIIDAIVGSIGDVAMRGIAEIGSLCIR